MVRSILCACKDQTPQGQQVQGTGRGWEGGHPGPRQSDSPADALGSQKAYSHESIIKTELRWPRIKEAYGGLCRR